MRVVIIGAGAIGSTAAVRLALAGRDVAVADGWAEHVEAIRERGLRLTGGLGEATVPVEAVTMDRVAELGRADLVLIATKSYDTEAAARLALALVGEDGIVASMQNGMNDAVVARVVGAERTLGCVVNFGGKMLGPGVAECLGALAPAIEVGSLSAGHDPRAEEVAALLSDIAPAVPTDSLAARRWAKLTHNAMFNALAGLTGIPAPPTGGPVPCQVAVNIAAEAIRVARASGVDATGVLGVTADEYLACAAGEGVAEVHEKLVQGALTLPAGARPSLLQDIEKGRRTEIDELNGYIVAAGREVGVPTPFNEAVVAGLTAMVAEGRAPDPANLRVFDALLAAREG